VGRPLPGPARLLRCYRRYPQPLQVTHPRPGNPHHQDHDRCRQVCSLTAHLAYAIVILAVVWPWWQSIGGI